MNLRSDTLARSGLVLGVLNALLAAAPAATQQVQGTVTDLTSGEPLSGVVVVLFDENGAIRRSILTDLSGAFSLPVSFTGEFRLHAQRLGYEVRETEWYRVTAPDTLRLAVQLSPEPIVVAEVTVTTAARRHINEESFLQRQQSGFGTFLGAEEIFHLRPTSTARLVLGRTSRLLPSTRAGGIILADTASNLWANAFAALGCPHVYVDGSRIPEEQHIISVNPRIVERFVPLDSYAPAHTVRGIEIYRNHREAPPEYQQPFAPSTCQVILIWTTFGFGDGGEP